MLRRKKKKERKVRPFRRFDEARMKSSISSYEWFIFIIALAQLCFLIYLLITAFI